MCAYHADRHGAIEHWVLEQNKLGDECVCGQIPDVWGQCAEVIAGFAGMRCGIPVVSASHAALLFQHEQKSAAVARSDYPTDRLG
jgi:prephenate dehydratase